MRALLENLFGVYTPISFDVVNSDGSISSVIPNGFSGVDWVYVLGVVIFIVCLSSLFKILGGLLKR